MTTELETNIVAVERVKEYTETPTEVNSSYFIYIPTQGVVSENDNRVRDKHLAVERVKEYTETPTEVTPRVLILNIYPYSQGVVRVVKTPERDRIAQKPDSTEEYRMTARVKTNIVAVERVKEYTGSISENDNRVRDKHCSCRRVKEYSENDNRVSENDKQLTSCRVE
ncbi:unnamed protein product [Mytilus edulis]|uniref:Uncharacterized protein n=1 Tax=Mytilus edulis TaxID=6550 RepID=A0A8S3R1G8_MYTED|nr:unnamed protein product [Mytilus edulis]